MLPEMPRDRSNQDQPAADAGRELTEPLVIIAIAGDELAGAIINMGKSPKPSVLELEPSPGDATGAA
jgi:hypothetical protein